MNPSLVTALLIFLSVDAIALFCLLMAKILKEGRRRKIRHFGDQAEKLVADCIAREFPGAVLMNNVFLKSGKGITQIDHILLCKWGVFVIETKSHNGLINTEKKEWVQIYGEKVVRFHSPLLQNEIHRKAVEALLARSRGTRHTPVKGIVVFTSRKVRFTVRKDGVVRLSDLPLYIKSGCKTVRRRGPLTASAGMHYLTRQKIALIEKAIRKGSVKSRKEKSTHEKTVRLMDRNKW